LYQIHDPKKIMRIYICISVPLVRHEPVISNIYGDSVLLSWQPAEFKGDFKFPPIVSYSIEIQDRPGVGPWTPFITGIQGTSYHVTGLHPDREYFFRVRGHAGDVFGEPSAPVYLTHRAGKVFFFSFFFIPKIDS
jgi:hypothetical protein